MSKGELLVENGAVRNSAIPDACGLLKMLSVQLIGVSASEFFNL